MRSLLRAVLAEDHPLMRESVARLLSEHCMVVDTVERGDAVFAAINRHRPDALVMDISMPGKSGLQVLPELRAAHPQLAIVLLTSHDAPVYRQAAMERGADAYVLKQNAVTELWSAVIASTNQRRALDPGDALKAENPLMLIAG